MKGPTLKNLALDTFRVLTELPEAERVQPPLPAECFLRYDSSGFELLCGGNPPDLFSDSDSYENLQ